ncbi:MAG: carbohydrate porin [Candidatus Cybelea sp.]
MLHVGTRVFTSFRRRARRSRYRLDTVLLAALLLGIAAPLATQPSGPRPPAPRSTPSPSPSGPTAGKLTVFGQYTGEFAANATGGEQLGSAFANSFLLGANYTFAHTRPDDVGSLHFIFTEGWGSSLTQNALGNIASVQGVYGAGETPRISELNYEQQSGKFDVQVGRLVMQSDFAASFNYWGCNLWCFYQNGATFDAAPTNSGYSYFPLSTWGASGRVSPSQSFYAQTGIFQTTPAEYANRGHGFNLSFNGAGIDVPLEFGFLSHDRNGNYNGSVRVGGYYDTSNALGAQNNLSSFVAPGSPALNQVPSTTYRGQSGEWLLVDHLISGSSAPNARGVAIFGTYAYGDPQTAFLSNFADAGIVVHGTFADRPNDTIALGWFYLDVNPRLRAFEYQLRREGFAVPTNRIEQDLELNYGIDLAPWAFLRPSIQYVINPAGTMGGYVYPGGAVGLHNALVIGFNATYLY